MKPRIDTVHDEGIMVSFADMLGALFAVFILAYILSILKADIDKKNNELKGTIYLSDKVLFGSGEAYLKTAGREALKSAAKTIKSNKEFETEEKLLLVQGYTDNVPIQGGKYRTNWELSTARAVTVVEYLITEGGIPPAKIAAAGFSEYFPEASNDSEQGKALNRRMKLVIIEKKALLQKDRK